MHESAQKLRGLVLAREPSGERFLKLSLLCPQHGVVTCLLRVSTRPTTTPAPDLFDTADITLAPAKNTAAGPRFISEYTVLCREPALGADYTRLAAASRLALIVLKNPLPPESTESIAALLARATTALASRPRPDITFFKTLWQLARNEGYPVREHWLATLPSSERILVPLILRQPLDNQETPVPAVVPIVRSLEQWLSRECHFVFPE